MKSHRSTSLLLFRHGETLWNRQKRIQGSCNSPLTDLGKLQAKSNGDIIRRENVKNIIASPAGRVQETLEFMDLPEYVSIRIDDRLVERSMGMWEAMIWNDVRTKWKKDYFRCRQNPKFERPPHGESLFDVERRVGQLLDEIFNDRSTDEDAGITAIVSHGGTTRSIFGWLDLIDKPEYENIRFHNNVVYKLVNIDDRWTLSHFLSGKGPFDGGYSSE